MWRGCKMPCPPQVPLSRLKVALAALAVRTTLYRNAAARIARTRRAHRYAAAIGLGVLLLGPSRLATNGAPALEECPPESEASSVVDIDAENPRGGLSAGATLPDSAKDMPKHWKREPCPRDPRTRVVDGVCFISIGPPPCPIGYEHNRECLEPVPVGKPRPSALGR